MNRLKRLTIFGAMGLFALPFALEAQEDISLLIGGTYFINCERTIAFGDYAVMTVSLDDKNERMVNFDLYSPFGVLDASLRNGQFSGPQAAAYAMQPLPDGFIIVDLRDERMVLKIKSVKNAVEKRYDLHVWADFFLPNGGRFRCTPEESNVPMLQYTKGSSFINVKTGIQLN